jgi:prepilin-type N-terminal cleavage/methylation domain-containing protein
MKVHTKNGFSLIELLVLIAVIGILMGIGALQMTKYIEQQRLTEAAKTLGETLRKIGHSAMTQSQEMTLDNTYNQTVLSWENEDAQTFEQVLPYDIKVTAQNPSGAIIFNGRGFPVSGYSFTISRNSKTRVVHLLATGAVTYQ